MVVVVVVVVVEVWMGLGLDALLGWWWIAPSGLLSIDGLGIVCVKLGC
jgi:uncharacterized membrane protein HdeD (DUF308 family)